MEILDQKVTIGQYNKIGKMNMLGCLIFGAALGISRGSAEERANLPYEDPSSLANNAAVIGVLISGIVHPERNIEMLTSTVTGYSTGYYLGRFLTSLFK